MNINKPRFSLEIFPPHDNEKLPVLCETIKKLKTVDPEFLSVTYGAGGSNQSRSTDTIKVLKNEMPIAAHITCVGESKFHVNQVIETWQNMGISRFVALRGDMQGAKTGTPFMPHEDGYQNTSDLIKGLREKGIRDIAVGGYPEIHPESENIVKDIENLKRKVDAGASHIITQYFFDAEMFFTFRDRVSKAGIKVPIIAGIMPIVSFDGIQKFSRICGASIPSFLHDAFENTNDPEKTALNLATDLCQKLMAEGVNDFHIYTLNRAELTLGLYHNLANKSSS